MKIAFVVQRYGAEVNGGAEALCRWVAEHLSSNIEIEILTTCAQDHVSWKNHYKPGVEQINNVTVRRFKVTERRNAKKFERLCNQMWRKQNSEKDELEWLHKQGPVCPSLLDYIEENKDEYDYFIFFTYLYYTTVLGLPLVADKALFIPTAHDENPIKLNIFRSLFKKPRAIIYNTPEEKELVNILFDNDDIESHVVGAGIDVPDKVDPEDFKRKYGMDNFVICVGRIEGGKGTMSLIDYFARYHNKDSDIKLVLLGRGQVPIPKNKNIFSLGFVSEQDKFNAIAASNSVIVPSELESLSLVSLEAWSLNKPILVNERSAVLKGHCERSNGGLYYSNYEEFATCLNYLLGDEALREKLGSNGFSYVKDNYNWPVIKKKYISIFEGLQASIR